MGLKRTLYANRKEIFVASILLCVFLFDVTQELPGLNEISKAKKSHHRSSKSRDQGEQTEEELKQQKAEEEAIKSKVIADFHEDIGNLTISTFPKARLVIYNRVPKCGSQTMSMLINHSSRRNKFKSWQLWQNGEVPERSPREQKMWVNEVYEELDSLMPKTKPLLFTRHQYYINFADHNVLEPLYMNLIRDPVDRFASFYYFQRYGNARGGGKKQPPGQMSYEDWNMPIDECVRQFKRECTSPIWHTVPYLCGNSPICQEKTERAIQETKRNIERNYFVIGVLEELTSFLKLLEKVLPQYFDGVLEIYKADQIRNDTHTLNKPKTITSQTREFLATKTPLQLEYEIYHFVRARFRTQMSKLGVEE